MAQMLYNPAKTAYLRFDGLAKTMQMNPTSPTKEKSNGVKGLLKRLKQKPKDNEEGSEEQEPLEIALDYFIAIRQQRNKLKQEA
jgi:hypothetical protein|tara:strand:+ start:85 stop:336 length:252 start_codon:yes stop_codon:yes gene_type:complete